MLKTLYITLTYLFCSPTQQNLPGRCINMLMFPLLTSCKKSLTFRFQSETNLFKHRVDQAKGTENISLLCRVVLLEYLVFYNNLTIQHLDDG